MRRIGWVLGVAVAVFLMATFPAMAISYTATQDGNFNNAATWGGAGYPNGSGDTGAIPSGIKVRIYEDWATAWSFTKTGSGTLFFDGYLNSTLGDMSAFTGLAQVQNNDSNLIGLFFTGATLGNQITWELLQTTGVYPTRMNYYGGSGSQWKTISGFGILSTNQWQSFGASHILDTVEPGSGTTAGTLTFTVGSYGSWTLDSGAEALFNVFDATTGSQLILDGGAPLTFASGSSVEVVLPATSVTITNLVLVQNAGTTSGFSSDIVIFTNSAGYDMSQTNVTQVGNNLVLNAAPGGGGEPIPEPGTLLLLGTGALGIVGYIRRRRLN